MSFTGENEVFVTKLDPQLQRLLASTFLGGIDSETASALTIDEENNILIAGWTESSDFPVVQSSFDNSHNLFEDGFVVRLDSRLQQLLSGTFIGGEGDDRVTAVSIQAGGDIALAGSTQSPDFPTTPDCYSSTRYEKLDGFVVFFDRDLATLKFATYLSGVHDDQIKSILANGDNTYITGTTDSWDFPLMAEKKGWSDIFIMRFNPNETPAKDPSAPVPSPVLDGHWQSSKSKRTAVIEAYLDVDICNNGDISGHWGAYSCVMDTGRNFRFCSWKDDKVGEPASGHIDFSQDNGTINLGDCRNVPVTITSKSIEKLTLCLHTANVCDLDFDLLTEINYQGEPGTYCGASGGSGGGGGSGGCFINTVETSE